MHAAHKANDNQRSHGCCRNNNKDMSIIRIIHKNISKTHLPVLVGRLCNKAAEGLDFVLPDWGTHARILCACTGIQGSVCEVPRNDGVKAGDPLSFAKRLFSVHNKTNTSDPLRRSIQSARSPKIDDVKHIGMKVQAASRFACLSDQHSSAIEVAGSELHIVSVL